MLLVVATFSIDDEVPSHQQQEIKTKSDQQFQMPKEIVLLVILLIKILHRHVANIRY